MKNCDHMDMSIVIIAHHEGRLIHPTLMSVFRSIDYASDHGITSEIVIVLDRPDEKTLGYLRRYRTVPDVRMAETALGDHGLSRNLGIALSSGRYVSVLEAHDLICQNWIFSTVGLLNNCRDPVVVHPEYLVEFDGGHKIRRLVNSTDPSFPITDMIVDHVYGASICSSETSLFRNHPYPPEDRASGFGFTDWHFTCETLAHDITHQIVSETVGFIRKRNMSMHPYTPCVMKPSRLFECDKWNQLIARYKTN